MEANRIAKEKKFGLVFEEHPPKLPPICSAKVKKRSKVTLTLPAAQPPASSAASIPGSI